MAKKEDSNRTSDETPKLSKNESCSIIGVMEILHPNPKKAEADLNDQLQTERDQVQTLQSDIHKQRVQLKFEHQAEIKQLEQSHKALVVANGYLMKELEQKNEDLKHHSQMDRLMKEMKKNLEDSESHIKMLTE